MERQRDADAFSSDLIARCMFWVARGCALILTALLPPLSSARSIMSMQIRLVWHRNGPHVEAQVVERIQPYMGSSASGTCAAMGMPLRCCFASSNWSTWERSTTSTTQFLYINYIADALNPKPNFMKTLNYLLPIKRPFRDRCAATVEFSKFNYLMHIKFYQF